MSMLSSVFQKRKNLQKRLNDFAHRIPAARAPSPPSPGSFASPDVSFDPYRLYVSASQSSLAQPPPQISKQNGGAPSASTSSGSGTASSKRISSPKVQLDFGHDSDWFPQELLHMRSESEPMLRPERNVSLGAQSATTGSIRAGTIASSSTSVIASNSSTALASISGPSGTGKSVLLDVSRRHEGDQDSRYEFGEDEVMLIGAPSPSPRGPDTPLFSVGSTSPSTRPHEVDEADTPAELRDAGALQAQRRPAPSPIHIPRRRSGSYVHLQRSASLSSAYPTHEDPSESPSHPEAHSDPESLYPSRAPSRARRRRTRSRLQRSRSASRPASEYSHYSDTDVEFDGMLDSAVSGTTLARQLAATYILSGSPTTPSHRRSRGHLARQDSATLPRGEYGFLFSRRSVRSSKSSTSIRGSVASNAQTYWRDAGAPPVPPMPEGLSPGLASSPASQFGSHDSTMLSPMTPLTTSRRGSAAGLDVRERRISNNSRRNSSNSSAGGGSGLNTKHLTLDPEIKKRRISRISEGSGSAGPSTGAFSPSQNNGSQASLPFAGEKEKIEVPEIVHEDTPSQSQKLEEHAQELIVPSPPSHHTLSPDAPTTATSASMSVYSSTQTSSSPNTMLTPGTSSSGSLYSTEAGMTAVLSPGGTSFSISPHFSLSPSPGRSIRSSLIGARSPLGSATETTLSTYPSPKPAVSLLPIGELQRPRSAQVPQSPSSHSQASSRISQDSAKASRPHSMALPLSALHPHLAAAASASSHSSRNSPDSPDLLDLMLFSTSTSSAARVPAPAPAPLASQHTGSSAGGSSRVGSPPAPISVPPINGGFPMSMSMGAGGDAPGPSTASAVRQTFPETPYAFTPLTGKSFGSPALPPSMRDVPPPLPRTATLAVRGGKGSRGRGADAAAMAKTMSSPPGKLNTAFLTPPLTGRDDTVGEQVERAQILSAIEERSVPGTPSSRPPSYAQAMMPEHTLSRRRSSPEGSPPSYAVSPGGTPYQQQPSSLSLYNVTEGEPSSRSPPTSSDRPASLVPAKRPLTPLPSPPESAIPLPPSPSPSEPPSLPVLSPELDASPKYHPLSDSRNASPKYLPLSDSRNATPSPIISSGRLSRRPSEASEISVSILAQTYLTTPDATPNKRVTRTRPPPPSGPRKPSSGPGNLYLRTRNGSVSSQNSLHAGPSTSRYPSMSLSASSPRFQTTPIKFRGLTMEAAQWTFTSQQLQELVSTAIKKSADASRIRLLPKELFTTQVPEEIERLEAMSAEVRTNYKLAARRRRTLMGSLPTVIENGDLAASGRIVEELSELTETMDNYSEELYCITDQLAQLRHLCDVHSSSALAMALRKLNSSFLKHLKEKQELRTQVINLEQERDDAWNQAQEAAQEIDALNEKLAALEGGTVPTPANSRRSSRVLVARKASMRASKAGLRSPSRMRSQRSSVATTASRNSEVLSTGIRSAGLDDVPPVPPIPVRTSLGVMTSGLPSRSPGMAND
ncbi:hypothetical protein EIP86_011115 [Pleurotus ostreatoroseus]|nr:hypothetical protein EIP86_011115 [Pleurotus ostreatoroseus]